MKLRKSINILLLLSVLAVSCQEDENLNLRDYPEPQITFSIQHSKDPLNATIKATYEADGSLSVDKNVAFKVQLATPAQKDVVVALKYDLKNIPVDKLSLPNEVIIPVGEVETVVTPDSLSFMDTLSEQIYEIGIQAVSVNGNTHSFHSDIAKIIISKEGFKSSVSLIGEQGNDYVFKRIYAGGKILNKEKMTFKMKAKLSKILKTDLDFNFHVSDEKLAKYVHFSPTMVKIPAGQLESIDVICEVADDFLLSNSEEEVYAFDISANPVQDNEYVDGETESGKINVRVEKTTKLLQQVASPLRTWEEIGREGWIPSKRNNLSGKPQYIIDNNYDSYVASYDNEPFWVSVELPSVTEVKGLFVDDHQAWYPPTKIQVYSSDDGSDWDSLGTVDVEVRDWNTHLYFEFLMPIEAKFFKYEVLTSEYGNAYVSELKLYH